MKFVIFIISIMFVFTGCAVKSVNNTDINEQILMPEVTLACLTPKNGVYFDAQNSREYSRKKHLKKCCILMPLVRQSDFRHLY